MINYEINNNDKLIMGKPKKTRFPILFLKSDADFKIGRCN